MKLINFKHTLMDINQMLFNTVFSVSVHSGFTCVKFSTMTYVGNQKVSEFRLLNKELSTDNKNTFNSLKRHQ